MASASASAGVNYICYVQGLSAKSDYRSVEVAFDQYGDIVDINFHFYMKDPETQVTLYYAFVTFKDEKSVDDAIQGMNGQDLDGWPITVTKHNPRGTAVEDNEVVKVAGTEEATVVISN